MVDNKHQSEEEVVIIEEEVEEPIGFNQAKPIGKGEKLEIDHFQNHLPGKGLRTATKITTIFGVIFSVIALMYYLLPIFASVIGGIIAMFLYIFMIFSVICTLGMILLNEGYRKWASDDIMIVPNFFFDISNHVIELSKYYLIVAIPAILLCSTGLTLAIIGQAKKYKFFTSYIVLNAIFLVHALFFTIIYFASGMTTFTN